MILSVFVLITSASYALWQITFQQATTNVITTGCFQIEFQDHNPIHLGSAYPISDEEANELTPYTFTITNACNSFASYQINLEILNTTTLENLGFLKVMLEDEKSILTENENVTKTLDAATSSYKLETGHLDANASKTYSLRLWMDEDTPTSEEFMNKVFESKITIVSSYLNEFDHEKPTTNIEVTNLSNKIKVDASNSIDNEKIKYYYYSLDGEHFEKAKESTYTFEVGNLTYGKGTETIKTLADSLNEEYTVYVKTEDEYGNQSEVVSQTLISGFAYDETSDNNLRYIGANPNNYIDIGDRDADGNVILWRVIGSMNNIKSSEEDESGKTRLKIIRNDSIGNFSWDSSSSNVNDGSGVNEWSQADANILLNDYYYNSKANQKCYNGQSNATVDCDFTRDGLSVFAKKFIDTAIWNTGANASSSQWNNILTSKFYEYERSQNSSKICSSGIECLNDNVERTTQWHGYVGLMYPSDYGYATSGGDTTNRKTCLNTILYNWRNVPDCYSNNWLYHSTMSSWLLTSLAISDSSSRIFLLASKGEVSIGIGFREFALFPTFYLKSNVNIISGTGELNNPYVVSLD